MVAEQNRLMAIFIRWIDEHGAEARGDTNALIYLNSHGALGCSIADISFVGALQIYFTYADQFIRENESDLIKYFENEETLRRTLYE